MLSSQTKLRAVHLTLSDIVHWTWVDMWEGRGDGGECCYCVFLHSVYNIPLHLPWLLSQNGTEDIPAPTVGGLSEVWYIMFLLQVPSH